MVCEPKMLFPKEISRTITRLSWSVTAALALPFYSCVTASPQPASPSRGETSLAKILGEDLHYLSPLLQEGSRILE